MAKPIEYSREALRMLGRIDRKTAARLIAKVEQLASDPAGMANNGKRLKAGGGLMRLRVGDWRIIYRDNVVIMVVRIAPRGGAYD